MGVEALVRGQQRRVDVDDAPGVALDEIVAQNPHVAGARDGIDAGSVDGLGERNLEPGTVTARRRQLGDRDALGTRQRQPLGIGLVRRDQRDFIRAIFSLRGVDQRGHV
jgi:hypothetical protein